MKKIKVFTSNCLSMWSMGVCYISPINWLLKLNHVKNSPSKDQYEWTEPYFLISEDDVDNEKTYQMLTDEGIDLVVFSVYIWNRREFLGMAKYIKEKNPNITVVVGGPDIDSHRDPEFFKKHPYIDWAMYGEGEIAFPRLLDHLAGHETNLINAVFKDGTIYPHEPVNKKDDVLKHSPYIEFKDEFSKFCQQFKDKKIFYCLTWETTKGCPYLCSFCDWSSGLHHKVRIWGKDELIPLWKKEMNLFSELGIPAVYWTNPNVGLTPQDEVIVDYVIDLKSQQKWTPLFISPQISKTKKEKSYQIIDKMLTHQIMASIKFDLQDIEMEVLDLIDRPEIPWEQHKVMIKDLIDKHIYKKMWGTEYVQPVWCNFIWGLPGQTLSNLRRNVVESGSLRMFPTHHMFEILPNSPAGDIEWQEKMGVKVQDVYLNVSERKNEIGPISSRWAKVVVETKWLPNKDWFIGVFQFNIYAAMVDYARAESQNKISFWGKEDLYFDNINFLNPIIEESYQHYIKTDRLEVVWNGQSTGFQPFVKMRRELLSSFFVDSDTAFSNAQKIMQGITDDTDEGDFKSIHGITPRSISAFVEQ